MILQDGCRYDVVFTIMVSFCSVFVNIVPNAQNGLILNGGFMFLLTVYYLLLF